MRTIIVQLLKPGKGTTIAYRGELVQAEQGHILIHARWERPALDLGYMVFEPGDHFYEHYYTDRWFNIFEVRHASGELKGWYCNITRPAQLTDDLITSEDLELDLFVSPDRQKILTLDMDEFEARDLAASDPAAHAEALAALAALKQMAQAGTSPFDAGSRDEHSDGIILGS